MTEEEELMLAAIKHEPERAVRPDVYGEGIFLECWQRHLQITPEYGDGYANERFQCILSDMTPFPTQRDATVAASFIIWLGTNCGNFYLFEAKRRFTHLTDREADRPDAYLFEWVRQNRRISCVNGGRRTIEALVEEPTYRDAEVCEVIAHYLGTPEGQAVIAEAEAEIEATRKAINDRNSREARARRRADALANAS